MVDMTAMVLHLVFKCQLTGLVQLDALGGLNALCPGSIPLVVSKSCNTDAAFLVHRDEPAIFEHGVRSNLQVWMTRASNYVLVAKAWKVAKSVDSADVFRREPLMTADDRVAQIAPDPFPRVHQLRHESPCCCCITSCHLEQSVCGVVVHTGMHAYIGPGSVG